MPPQTHQIFFHVRGATYLPVNSSGRKRFFRGDVEVTVTKERAVQDHEEVTNFNLTAPINFFSDSKIGELGPARFLLISSPIRQHEQIRSMQNFRLTIAGKKISTLLASSSHVVSSIHEFTKRNNTKVLYCSPLVFGWTATRPPTPHH